MATQANSFDLSGLDFSLGTLFNGLNFNYGNNAFGSYDTGGVSQASNVADTAASTGLLSGLFNRESMFGGTNANGQTMGGWVSPLASIGSAIFGGIQGNNQLKLAEKQMKEARRQFDTNYSAHRQSLNPQMEDRQRARVASNSSAYESVDDYMNRNRIN